MACRHDNDLESAFLRRMQRRSLCSSRLALYKRLSEKNRTEPQNKPEFRFGSCEQQTHQGQCQPASRRKAERLCDPHAIRSDNPGAWAVRLEFVVRPRLAR